MSNTTSTILDQLKKSTQSQHQALEEIAQSDKLAQGNLKLADYKALLIANYWAHAALEAALEQNLDLHCLLPDWPDRQKRKLLEQDLVNVGLNPAQLSKAAPAGKAPVVRSEAQAWGMLYVMEGSSLGGVIIARLLQKTVSLQNYMPPQFYGCYGADTGYYWKEFRNRIVQAFRKPISTEEALDTARLTFGYYKVCFMHAKAYV